MNEDRRATLRLVTPPILLTLVVTLIGIDQRQFWRDEHATWWASTLPLGLLRRLVENIDMVLLPYYLLMHVWVSVFGTSEIAMRLPSALLISLAAGLLALIGRRLLDAPAGLLAGLLFALVPAVSRYGAEARPYAMALAATLASTLLLLRALDRPSRWRWAGYGAAVVWIGCSHLVALSILAVHLVLVVAHLRGRADRDRRVLIGWPVSAAVAVAVLAPMVVLSSGQGSQISWIAEPTWAVIRAFPGDVFHSAPVAAIVLTLTVCGLALLVRSPGPGRWTAAALTVWILLPPLLAYLTFDALGLFYPRYLLFTMPAALLPAAWALRRLAAVRPAWSGRALVALGLAAALALGVAGLPQQRFVRSNAVEDEYAWREAATWLNDRLEPGDRVAYVGFKRLHRGFSYEYDQLPGPDPKEVYSYISRERRWWWNHKLPADTAAALDGVTRFWLVTAKPRPRSGPFSHLPDGAGAYFEEHYRIAETQTFHHLQVTLLLERR
jgi:mannosyltransferase